MTLPTPPLLSTATRLCAAALLLGAAGAAMAQYKIVGPDGKVTYTDKPPTAAETRNGSGGSSAGGGGSGGGGSFPYETRQAIARYPVTLYAQKSCDPCDQARRALRARGVPFSEYSIDSNPDADQLKQRFGELTLPVITVGNQTIKGFRQSDVDSYLDAAGYPKTAHLAGYSWPAAVPLAPAAPVARAAPASAAAPTNGAKIDLPQPSKNGIQF
jgi:glutaredoxin